MTPASHPGPASLSPKAPRSLCEVNFCNPASGLSVLLSVTRTQRRVRAQGWKGRGKLRDPGGESGVGLSIPEDSREQVALGAIRTL